MKIFIIGSITQVPVMEKVKEALGIVKTTNGQPYYEVEHVKHQPDQPLETLIRQAYLSIAQTDQVMVIMKPDGSIGEGTMYEIEYAKLLDKAVTYIQPHDQQLLMEAD